VSLDYLMINILIKFMVFTMLAPPDSFLCQMAPRSGACGLVFIRKNSTTVHIFYSHERNRTIGALVKSQRFHSFISENIADIFAYKPTTAFMYLFILRYEVYTMAL
jgi:hypothetical protein